MAESQVDFAGLRGGTVDLLSSKPYEYDWPSLSTTANYIWIMPTPSATEMVGIPDLQGPSTGAGRDYDAESRT